jgi:hypothetical protein
MVFNEGQGRATGSFALRCADSIQRLTIRVALVDAKIGKLRQIARFGIIAHRLTVDNVSARMCPFAALFREKH